MSDTGSSGGGGWVETEGTVAVLPQGDEDGLVAVTGGRSLLARGRSLLSRMLQGRRRRTPESLTVARGVRIPDPVYGAGIIGHRIMVQRLMNTDPTLTRVEASQIIDGALTVGVDVNLYIRERERERRRVLDEQREEEREVERARIELSQRARRGQVVDISQIRARIAELIEAIHELEQSSEALQEAGHL